LDSAWIIVACSSAASVSAHSWLNDQCERDVVVVDVGVVVGCLYVARYTAVDVVITLAYLET
jgi:hypothetical protein